MTKRRRWHAFPLALARRKHGRIEAAQSAQDQKHVGVGRRIVDGHRHVGDADIARCARMHVDLVIAGAVVRDEFDARGEVVDELGVQWAGERGGAQRTEDNYDAVEAAALAFMDEGGAVAGLRPDEVAELREGFPFIFCAGDFVSACYVHCWLRTYWSISPSRRILGFAIQSV